MQQLRCIFNIIAVKTQISIYILTAIPLYFYNHQSSIKLLNLMFLLGFDRIRSIF